MQKFRELIRAPLFSPPGLAVRALLLVVAFGLCELAGWREHTTFISGTVTSADMGINASATFGLIYMLAYFGFVLAAPILMIAAFVIFVFRRFFRGAETL